MDGKGKDLAHRNPPDLVTVLVEVVLAIVSLSLIADNARKRSLPRHGAGATFRMILKASE